MIIIKILLLLIVIWSSLIIFKFIRGIKIFFNNKNNKIKNNKLYSDVQDAEYEDIDEE